MNRHPVSRVACRAWLVVGLAWSAGCAHPSSYLAFFGRRVDPLAQAETPWQLGDVITAEGAVNSGLGARTIAMSFANHGGQPLQFSYVVDQYIAKTFNGRTIALEKADFLTYPHSVPPGDEQTVQLRLPRDLPVADIAQLVATVNNGRTVVVLRPLNPTTRLIGLDQPRVVGRAVGQASGSGSVARHASAAFPRGPLVPDAPEVPHAVPLPPIGTVPVEVEFQQALGSSLAAEVQWDALADAVTLGHGERQLFYVVPGPHELQVRSRMPGVAETSGRVPIIVSAERPIRITVEADARLTGVGLTVRVWKGADVVTTKTFGPGMQG